MPSYRIRIAIGAPKNDPLVYLYETTHEVDYSRLGARAKLCLAELEEKLELRNVYNTTMQTGIWGIAFPLAIWHDVTILAPWTLWEETRDASILAAQYESVVTWTGCIPKNKEGAVNLWDLCGTQLGVSYGPTFGASSSTERPLTSGRIGSILMPPPAEPFKALTDPALVANAFLINSLDHMVYVATILRKQEDVMKYQAMAEGARSDFTAEYVTANGRLVSDSQTAYGAVAKFMVERLAGLQRLEPGWKRSRVQPEV
ncbi:hypothetical protein ACJ41O_006804 [Fusarium nematophilum]